MKDKMRRRDESGLRNENGLGNENGSGNENESGDENVLRDKNGLTEKEFLASYTPKAYPRPSVAADIVVFTVTDEERDNYRKLPRKELRVLLIQRGGHPYLNCWALPGGFVRPEETTEQTAYRELREETGVNQVYLEQLYTFSQPGRDPRTWVMSSAYMALIDSGKVCIQAGDDAAGAAWFEASLRIQEERDGKEVWKLELSKGEQRMEALLEKEKEGTFAGGRILENNGLAFDHAQIIAYGLERLRGKLAYTDLALGLMPEYFTLTQLQQVYEVILDKKLLAAAFRRKIAPMVEGTEKYTENEGHRPSQLFRKKEGE